MSLGEELAVKAGKRRLQYRGEDDPIEALSFIVSGQGIAPTLQIIKTITSDSDSAIGDLEVLWINERKKDFVLNSEMEDLESKNSEKLFVTRVIDKEAINEKTQINDQLREAVMPYQKGRLALLLGPEIFIKKSQELCLELGYPLENILSIVAI